MMHDLSLDHTWLLLPTLLLCCLQVPDEAEVAVLALSIAIDHPAFSAYQQVLCAAAQACKAWQLAVQQCGVSSTDAVMKLDNQLQKLHSFASWLHKHMHVVRSISVFDVRPLGEPPMKGYPAPSTCTRRDRADAAAQLLQLASEAAAAQRATATTPPPQAAAAAAVSAAPVNRGTATLLEVPQQQQQRGLRLASFSTDCLLTPGLLAALPAYSLTRLDLNLQLGLEYENVDNETWLDGPAVAAALAQLSSLRELRIGNSTMRDSMSLPGSFLYGVAELRSLMMLEVMGDWQRDVQDSLRQLLAQPRQLRQLHVVIDEGGRWKMDLVQLQQLHTKCAARCGFSATRAAAGANLAG
jgi:hypothetical protein